MASDSERREVAARLRELVPCLFDDGEYIDCGEVEESLGLVNDDGAWYKADGVMRLADLIEPDEHSVKGNDEEQAEILQAGYRSIRRLLELADMMELCAGIWSECGWDIKPEQLANYAHLIRNALGIKEGGTNEQQG